MKIIEAIQASASLANSPDSLMGYGIPDLGKALFLIQGMNPIPLTDESLFRIFPNPFTDRLRVDFFSPERQEISIQLLTLTGRVMATRKSEVGYTSVNSIELSEFHTLPDGIYILRIVTETTHHDRKVIRISQR
jgi:hypothetical protein